MSDVPDNDFLEAEVESGVAPLRAMGLSADVIEEAANVLRLALADHPRGRYLMNRVRPRVVKESGPTEVGNVDGEGGAAPAKAGSSR